MGGIRLEFLNQGMQCVTQMFRHSLHFVPFPRPVGRHQLLFGNVQIRPRLRILAEFPRRSQDLLC